MRSILISYDLIGTDETSEDYRRLIDHIKTGYSNWAKVLYSAFVVRTTLTPEQVRDNVEGYIDGGDRVFVCELTGVAAWRNAMCSNDWLQKHL
jgi:5'-3' exonuclease